MENTLDPTKERSLQTIRKIQAKYMPATDINIDDRTRQIRLKALEAVQLQEAASSADGDYLRSGPFKYPARSEQLRWLHTKEIIERVEPGPFENPYYLAILARQTASIEMILRGELRESPNKHLAEVTDRVLLATIQSPFVNAYALSDEVAAHREHVIVFLSSGLIQFLYQAAKAVVLALKPLKPPPGRTSCFSYSQEDTEAMLSKKPYPINLLLGTLGSYFFRGFPRDPTAKLPKGGVIPFLELLITFSERYVIAHEYGHALLHHELGKEFGLSPQTMTTELWEKEYQADIFAYLLVLESAMSLDLLPPNVALEGPLFALHAIDVLREVGFPRKSRHGKRENPVN